jgi:hypothetical protein
MAFPRPVSLSAALADLRAFLATRQRHQWLFAALSLAIPFYFMTLILMKTVEKEYKPPEVTFVTSYAKDRSDAEIRAQQKLDAEKLERERAEREQVLAERRRKLEPITKKLDDLGF